MAEKGLVEIDHDSLKYTGQQRQHAVIDTLTK